jgi:hypothetical protein
VRRETAALRDFDPAYDRCGSKSDCYSDAVTSPPTSYGHTAALTFAAVCQLET